MGYGREPGTEATTISAPRHRVVQQIGDDLLYRLNGFVVRLPLAPQQARRVAQD